MKAVGLCCNTLLIVQTLRTREFIQWLDHLRDRDGKARIQKRLNRIQETGHLGVTRSVGEGVQELKLDFGPGYRVYYAVRGTELIYLLAGGDKSTQREDIQRAIELLETLEVQE